MNPPLSIIATFWETFQIIGRYWKLVLGVSLLIAAYLIASSYLTMEMRTVPMNMFVVPLALIVTQFLVMAMATAAVLGVLKSSSGNASHWPIIVSSVKAHTGALFRLALILTLFASAIIVPISISIAYFDVPKIEPGIAIKIILAGIAILYLVFVKFALANPIVVVEGEGAIDAIITSWEMTKGRFGYVLGCYVFLATLEYFVDTGLSYFGPGIFHFIEAIRDILGGFWACLWDLMAWCMYNKIKEAQPLQVPSASVQETE